LLLLSPLPLSVFSPQNCNGSTIQRVCLSDFSGRNFCFDWSVRALPPDGEAGDFDRDLPANTAGFLYDISYDGCSLTG